MEEASHRGRILIVDDDAAVRETMAEILSEAGYDCIQAENGEEAVGMAAANPRKISLALIDLAMPGMDGAETYRRLKGLNPNVRTILTSGYLRDQEIDRLIERGVDAFLPKPFRIDDLVELVEQILQSAD
jgi:CheY-like chemotaxis protein